MRLIGTTGVTSELQSARHLQLQSVFCEASEHVYSASARLQSPIEKINYGCDLEKFATFFADADGAFTLTTSKALDTDSLRWVGLSFFLCGPGPILLRLSIK